MKETKNRNEMRRRKVKREITRQGIKEGKETNVVIREREKKWDGDGWNGRRNEGRGKGDRLSLSLIS